MGLAVVGSSYCSYPPPVVEVVPVGMSRLFNLEFSCHLTSWPALASYSGASFYDRAENVSACQIATQEVIDVNQVQANSNPLSSFNSWPHTFQ